jgi:hypothetical protein
MGISSVRFQARNASRQFIRNRAQLLCRCIAGTALAQANQRGAALTNW